MSNALKSRRERERQARYDAILDAAEQVFSEKGYDRTSMDDIARTASLSRALLYVYFKDKAAIQRGIMLRAGQSLVARFEQARDTEQDGLAQIRAMGKPITASIWSSRTTSPPSPRPQRRWRKRMNARPRTCCVQRRP